MFPPPNVSTPNFLYRFPDNTQQYQFETGIIETPSDTAQGNWGTITASEMRNTIMPALAAGALSYDLKQIWGLPRGMGDSSSRFLAFDASTFLNTWDKIVIDVSYVTPFGNIFNETLNVVNEKTSNKVYDLLSAQLRVPGAGPSTFTSNLVINKPQSGLTRIFQPDGRNHSWEVSLQVMIRNISHMGDQKYTAWMNNCPTSVFNNASTMVPSTQITTYGGYADDKVEDPVQFNVSATMLNASTPQLVQVPFAVQNVWVEIEGSPTSFSENVIYYITLLQNGRWL